MTILSASGTLTIVNMTLLDGDKGDITVSAGGATWTIDPLAVTDSKINDVAWSKITGAPSTVGGSGTTNEIAYFSGSSTLSSLATATYPSLTELSYVKGLTSSAQTQIGNKQDTLVSGTNIKTINSTSLLGSGDIAISATPGGSNGELQYNNSGAFGGLATSTYPSLTEIAYVKGVTSAIQTQINAKQATLVSGTNIKTVNSTSLLGSGNISISASPGGSSTHVQYNSSGSFAGDANFVYDSSGKLITLTQSALAATPAASILLTNSTAATSTVQQSSPSLNFRGKAFKTNSSTSENADFRFSNLPNSTIAPRAELYLQTSVAGSGWSTLGILKSGTSTVDGPNTENEITWNSKTIIKHSQITTGTPGGYTDTLAFENASGSWIHHSFKFSSNYRQAITYNSDGTVTHRTANQGVYNFEIGSTLGSTTQIVQIYNGGLYCGYKGLFGGKLTSGSADVNSLSTFCNYGSSAAKVRYISAATETLGDETFVLLDPTTAAACTGTPSVCNTWTGSGESVCNSHSAVGCNWSAGTSCSTFNGDIGACGGQAGCTVDISSCSGANNAGSSACTDQNTAYGGSCSYDTSTCSGLSSTASCNGTTGCTATVSGDCNSLSDGGGDGANCATQPECSYDSGSGTCSGSYFTSCSGEICQGTYNNGGCSGTYGAVCQGTAACSNISSESPCNSESGCAWTPIQSITLPTITSTNSSSTGRYYMIERVGTAGESNILPGSGDSFFHYGSSLTLPKPGDRVILNSYIATAACSSLATEGSCNGQSPSCSWTNGCSGDEFTCDAPGCSWNGSACVGNYSCSGSTYVTSKLWYTFNYDRGLMVVSKTSNYATVITDDIINCTSGSFNVTLMSAVVAYNKTFIVKNTGAGTITINTTSSQTVDGGASGTVTILAGKSKHFTSNGANWLITAAF
jgi:hypothetical protein